MIRLDSNPFGWYSPNIGNLPGGGTFQDLTNGLGGYVLAASVVAALLAAGAWLLGSSSGNIALAERGKQGSIAAALVTLLVGAAAGLLRFFFTAGQGLH
jgi:Family of unknown function (DUF6112)